MGNPAPKDRYLGCHHEVFDAFVDEENHLITEGHPLADVVNGGKSSGETCGCQPLLYSGPSEDEGTSAGTYVENVNPEGSGSYKSTGKTLPYHQGEADW